MLRDLKGYKKCQISTSSLFYYYILKQIQKLRKHIEDVAVEEPYMGERIPLNWLTFDDQKEKISGGKPVMTLKQVMKGIEMEDEPELLTMLKFYHDLGHIIYFGGDGAKKSKTLKDVVILDPHWLINAFKKILIVEPRKEQTVKYRQSWNLLKDEGILEDLLIDLVWQSISEHKQALLDLMDKFDLLCKRVDEEEEHSSPASSMARQPCLAKASYYVPSMLRQRTSRPIQLETIEKNSSVFFVDFKEFLPDGLYHRLVVRALRWSQDLGGRKPDLLYDRASFYVDEHHQFALQMVHQPKRAYIKVSVIRAEVIPPPQSVKKPSADVTRKVKDFVEENLLNLKTMWIERVDYCISVQCPDKKHKVIHFLPLDECMVNSAVDCYFEYSRVSIKTDEIQAMFKQKSPEEEASAREERQPMSDIFFREIANDIGREWKRLATNLHLKHVAVFKIEIEHRESVDEQIFQMLVLWRQKRGNKVNEMRKELIDALIKVDRRDLADKVRDY
ncbi:uncharacterized protein LOC119731912 [Patiria miniata]|uniref:Death domain-containing protein n=1 Tax=Patiria miniata TaxID=46514 RepID=A0A914ACP8_PATMI|nr:uncharacterized protein LOC119731912 [Patiria miniata]